jgi:diacylglycerol O-acyltransferase / wax synthase
VDGEGFFDQMSALDAFFLYIERDEAPLHIGGVYIFEGTSRVAGERGALGIARTLEERLHLVPRYRQKVQHRPLRLGHPVWVDDPQFDLDYHLRHVTLPRPGGAAQLREYVARVFAQRMDPVRPLWELYVVEGLAGGRVALIHKVHHAMVDGISTVDIGTLLFDMQPEPYRPTPPPWRPRPAPDDRALALSGLERLRGLADVDLSSLSEALPRVVADRVPEAFQSAVRWAAGSPWSGTASLARTLTRPARQLSFNQPIGRSRRIGHVVFPLDGVKQVKDVLGGTVNDVVLAIVAQGMRRWLLGRGEQAPETMRVLCPVSVRDGDARHALGNQLSGMIAELPLGDMSLATRLARVSSITGDLKESRQAAAAQSLTALTGWAPATLQALGARLGTQPDGGFQSVVNMIVTNIPGPQIPFYTGGAQLLEVWPLVPVYHMLGLNLAVVSYNGLIHMGLVADPDLVPDVDALATSIRRAASQYRTLAQRRAG